MINKYNTENKNYRKIDKRELENAISQDNVMELRDKIKRTSRDEDLDYKILKTKASSHFGAHIKGPLMEWYYRKFTDYIPEKYRKKN